MTFSAVTLTDSYVSAVGVPADRRQGRVGKAVVVRIGPQADFVVAQWADRFRRSADGEGKRHVGRLIECADTLKNVAPRAGDVCSRVEEEGLIPFRRRPAG